MKAFWNGKLIAQSTDTILVEGHHYFPYDSVNEEYLTHSETNTVCHWKGTASYYNLIVDGKENKDAAWYYPETRLLANNIKGYIAFWKGVKVEKS